MTDATESKPRYINHYCHENCPVDPGIEWSDIWLHTSNDRCPACGREIEPYESKELGDVDETDN